jgi:hypothetical protein
MVQKKCTLFNGTALLGFSKSLTMVCFSAFMDNYSIVVWAGPPDQSLKKSFTASSNSMIECPIIVV